MTIGVAVAKARWNDGRPAEQPDLPTMSMTAQHKRNPLRHPVA